MGSGAKWQLPGGTCHQRIQGISPPLYHHPVVGDPLAKVKEKLDSTAPSNPVSPPPPPQCVLCLCSARCLYSSHTAPLKCMVGAGLALSPLCCRTRLTVVAGDDRPRPSARANGDRTCTVLPRLRTKLYRASCSRSSMFWVISRRLNLPAPGRPLPAAPPVWQKIHAKHAAVFSHGLEHKGDYNTLFSVSYQDDLLLMSCRAPSLTMTSVLPSRHLFSGITSDPGSASAVVNRHKMIFTRLTHRTLGSHQA